MPNPVETDILNTYDFANNIFNKPDLIFLHS